MRFVPELGGHVVLGKKILETSIPGIFVAGDVSGWKKQAAPWWRDN
jgi:thioredoxin reductase